MFGLLVGCDMHGVVDYFLMWGLCWMICRCFLNCPVSAQISHQQERTRFLLMLLCFVAICFTAPRWTAVWGRRLWSLRFLVFLEAAWFLPPPDLWTGTTMTSDVLVTQPATPSNGHLTAPHLFMRVLPLCVIFCWSKYFFFLYSALKAGMQRPLLVCPPHKAYKNSTLVAALGALHALYTVRKDFSVKESWTPKLYYN